MAATVKQLRDWLSGRRGVQEIAVDEGGLTLVVVGDESDYLEIGGVPDDTQCECGRPKSQCATFEDADAQHGDIQ